MKYIQDESTNTLIFYIFFWIAVVFLIVKWDLYEKEKARKKMNIEIPYQNLEYAEYS